MTSPISQTSPVIQDAMDAAGLIPGKSPEPVLLPDPASLFSRRAKRLRHLSQGHGMAGWLDFVAQLADAQHSLSAHLPSSMAPETAWPDYLAALVRQAQPWAPAQVWQAADLVLGMDGGARQSLTDRLVNGAPLSSDLAAAPLVMAALQLAWTNHAADHAAASLSVPATQVTCPVCGGAPVAGVIHVGMQSGGLRYLHCGLCHTAWHHVRATCIACGDTKHVTQSMIDGQDGSARAEVCDACNSYLKLIMADKAPGFDPVADDLASIALDILVGEEGYARIGINPFLLQAEE